MVDILIELSVESELLDGRESEGESGAAERGRRVCDKDQTIDFASAYSMPHWISILVRKRDGEGQGFG